MSDKIIKSAQKVLNDEAEAIKKLEYNASNHDVTNVTIDIDAIAQAVADKLEERLRNGY